MEKLRRELEAAVEALEQGRQELSSFVEQVCSFIDIGTDDSLKNYKEVESVDG